MSLCFLENDLSYSFILEVDEIAKVAILWGGGRWELARNLVRVRVTGFNFGGDGWKFGESTGIDSVYSVALCRGDINQDVYLRCLNEIIVDIQKACPKSIYASAFVDYCSLRYNNDTLLGNNRIDMYDYENDPQNSTNVALLNQVLRSLLDKLKVDVSTGDSLRKFASGYTSGPDFTNIYALMQCTLDLSKQECNACLDIIIIRIPRLMHGKVGGRVLAPMEKEKHHKNCDNSKCYPDIHWCHNNRFTLYLYETEEEEEANPTYAP
ncbi:cysteine-rich receptor-like protein kinase 26 [Tanacetum coccineum]